MPSTLASNISAIFASSRTAAQLESKRRGGAGEQAGSGAEHHLLI
jgi:hypothetical protein